MVTAAALLSVRVRFVACRALLGCERRGRLQPALEARAVERMRAVAAGERVARAVRAAAAQHAGVAEEAEPAEAARSD